jgi:hypothetical protein
MDGRGPSPALRTGGPAPRVSQRGEHEAWRARDRSPPQFSNRFCHHLPSSPASFVATGLILRETFPIRESVLSRAGSHRQIFARRLPFHAGPRHARRTLQEGG